MRYFIWLIVISLSFAQQVYAVAKTNEPIQPIPNPKISDQEKVELGKMLFFEPRLSKSQIISCNTCHNLSMGGGDNRPASIGHKWTIGPIKAPTVFNSSLNIAQFWDGRAKDLKEQAAGPIANDIEMGATHKLATETIASIPEYQKRFAKVYGKQPISIDTITDAIATFEETLLTPNSRFDQYLNGEETAITQQEKSGYELFKNVGCVACHNGQAVGGNSFQKMGLIKPYQTENEKRGRIELTGKPADDLMFKVPTLRNVSLNAPYFHDGQYWKLEDAVKVMAEIQLGKDLTDTETRDIVAFLNTLNGERPQISLPLLPPSTNKTPRSQAN
ncbi:cytochrome-c peroxidase [Teredinibacter sp. KSP-S5-2]|uniref:cytochrome-c peroxidase n=1 Tax=Teredinibacter sp. KSP-S5-2 TaxID=3034506 RepID=UPI0029343504|nr:cytochrome-c peroxidase [Teredinibacter sp. KSP-S5-2]WNO09481.1 cytochrome-c peroxidase [Teredinibacter sp. KSP-S5-2]